MWELFESATHEQRVLIFQRTLSANVIDDDYAFEMLTDIRADCGLKRPEEWAAYVDLLKTFQEQAPKLYKKSQHYYQRDLISFAIIEGQWQDIPELLKVYIPGNELDLFLMVIEQLKYHGQVRPLVDAMKTAYPRIKASRKYVEWASEDFAGDLMELMLVDYLETTDEPQPDDTQFLDRTTFLLPWRDGWLEWFIPSVMQPAPSAWRVSDFFENPASEDWMEKLARMLLELIASQWREGVPLSRGLLAWHKWNEIFHEQVTQKPAKSSKNKRKGQQPSLAQYLIPDVKYLDRILGECFSFLGGEPYIVAATLELIPAYLDFLCDMGLVQIDEKEHAFSKIKPLVIKETPNILEYYNCDPIAIENMLASWN